MSSALPRITCGVPGCGGQLKAVPEDFEVEELPAYPASGEGEHLFLWVEKRALSTPELARRLARGLGLGERDVSYAGLKDQQAVTRQQLCVPARFESKVAGLPLDPSFRVLSVARHRNKLRTGHLAGNRFRLRLRGVRDVGAARAKLALLAEWGLPNYFGEQRFGRFGDNASKGKALLMGKGGERVARFERKLFLSALQAELFNRALAQRLAQGTFLRALPGDVLKKRETRGEFVCEQPEVDQPRVESFEVSAAGPMFGPRMTAAKGQVAEAEAAILALEGLSPKDFERGRGETEGTRRPYRLKVDGVVLEPEGSDLVVAFTLPAGSYATVLLAELVD